MTRNWLLLGALCGLGLGASAAALPLVPLPASVVTGAGELRLGAADVIAVPRGDNGARNAADRLAERMQRTGGPGLAVSEGSAGAIRFVRAPGLPREAYRLAVAPGGATITASDDAGLFYGGVTLWQLTSQGRVPAVSIADAPRFGWRGLMLDSARHFQSPRFVKALIDAMAAVKLNTLHWHLTDDQGWRIEIRKYPRLTGIGAWRTPATAPGAPPLPREGGFYSQVEIRDIIAYAAARGITIVPEIEMPGHALAAIRAYPALGTGVAIPPGAEADWGVFPCIYNTDDATFAVLEDVLAEVMALFPSPYIHIGGDEAVHDQWQASPAVRARMAALGIADTKALQGWFTARIGRFLAAHGRKLVGWDEILDGGVPVDAAVMSWRGVAGAITAARAGHDAVLAPAPTLYLDHLQGWNDGPGRAPPMGLAKVYGFDPIPPGLTPDEARHILGLQANLWTEHVRGDARTGAMAFPRAAAVAEIGWSPNTGSLADFGVRLAAQYPRLAAFGINASPTAFTPVASAEFTPATDRVGITLASEVGAAIHYTLDGSPALATSPQYAAPLVLPLPSRLRARAFDGATALPGELDTNYDATSVRRRTNAALETCTDKLVLALEDDAPAAGPRASFRVDILDPCWRWRATPLDGVTAIRVDVGQLPFNFQLGKDRAAIRLRPPATAAGEIEVRDGCAGPRLAVLPLAPAVGNPQVTTLSVPIAPMTGGHDLCLTYTAASLDTLWVVAAVQLVVP